MSYLRILQDIFVSLSLPYRHFVHWNISKAIIFVYTMGLAFVLAFPWLMAIAYLAYRFSFFVSPMSIVRFLQHGEIDLWLAQAIAENVPFFLLTVFLVIVTGFLIVFAFSYGYVLLHRVFLEYRRGNRLPFMKNSYFSVSLFARCLGVFSVIIGKVLLISVGYLAILIGGFLALRGSISDEDTLKIATGYLSTGLAILFVVTFVYVGLRLGFSFFFLLLSESEGERRTVRSALKASQSLTRGRQALRAIGYLVPPTGFIGLAIWLFETIESLVNTGLSEVVARRIDWILQFLLFEGMLPFLFFLVFFVLRSSVEDGVEKKGESSTVSVP